MAVFNQWTQNIFPTVYLTDIEILTITRACLQKVRVSVCNSVKVPSLQGPLETKQSQQNISVAMYHSLSAE